VLFSLGNERESLTCENLRVKIKGVYLHWYIFLLQLSRTVPTMARVSDYGEQCLFSRRSFGRMIFGII